MTIPRVWEEDFRVLTFHMDPQGKAHLTSICNFLQEGASAHAESAGFGFQEMLSRNQVWVLSRLKVEIDHYPAWKDQLKLTTWSRGNEGIFYIRDFIITDSADRPIVRASSSWAAINTKSRRPELVNGLEDGLYSNRDKKAFDQSLGKLPALTSPELLRVRKIEYTDIDLVYHVNNVKYIELIVNSFSKKMHMMHTVSSIEINYLGEATYAENVLINREQVSESVDLVNIVRESDNKEVCRAKLTWNKAA